MNFTNKEAESIVYSMERIAESLSKMAEAHRIVAEIYAMQVRKSSSSDFVFTEQQNKDD